MIYFIQDESVNLIKIGYTEGRDAEVRLKQLQTGSPAGLVLLRCIDGDRAEEKRLHGEFASARERGEWFKPTPTLLQYILNKAESRAFDAGFDAGKTKAPPSPTKKTDGPYTFYFAGKIEKHCWRHDLVDRLREAMPGMISCPGGGEMYYVPEWPVLKGAILKRHNYAGPFFAACDHGCFHSPDNHGMNAQGFFYHPDWGGPHGRTYGAPYVHDLCLDAIHKADVVFAWIDALDCYGTIVEIGYALAAGKKVWVAGPKRYRDMWFVYESAEMVNVDARRLTPRDALIGFLVDDADPDLDDAEYCEECGETLDNHAGDCSANNHSS